MDTRLLSAEHTTGVRPELPAERYLVLPLPGPRPQCPSAADPGGRRGKISVRVRTPTSPASSGGLARQSQARAPTAQARGSPGAYEGAPQESHQSAQRSSPNGNGRWSILAMDFVHDQLANGRKFCVLTVIDKWHRQCVALQADFSLRGQSVVDVMNEIAISRELPYAITVDHGTEFTSKTLDEWCYLRGVKLDVIRPGKPTETGFIESFKGRLRDECVKVNEFATLEEAQEVLRSWLHDYNHLRPHGSLGHLTLSKFAMNGQKTDPEASEL
jgi:putative transposase